MGTTEGDENRRQADSFGGAAPTYERGRPSYPPEAVAWLVPESARVVVDLGAGTGRLTRSLRAPGREVVAVDPSAGMRAEFTRVLPDLRVLDGTGEAIPLPDSSVDAVVCAQAWHWVDPAAALPEVARVLRPGGRLGLVWNTRDSSVAWQAELDALLGEYLASPTNVEQEVSFGDGFVHAEKRDFRWRHPATPAQVRDMVASRSYVITMDPHTRADLLDRVDALVGDMVTEVAYVTECFRADAARP